MRSDVQEIKQEIKEIRLEVKSLEIRTTGNEKDIININKQLDKISANTTWILRLIVRGIVVGLSQIVKTIGLQTKYVPLLNLTLGIVLGVLFLDGDIKTNVFQGIIIGLSASGLFDHTKIMKKDVDSK
ncbi:hemolysin XhlA family protein [Bacillus cereus]|nr:hemolysin XhlA family protein [Bacillus cereus]MCU4760600.1 hemolysin XhlA family protein [Bacillus cereus]MCU5313005.1 hemolysin XhlA family protein [Bacillus cereus]MCU5441589.1 hemolysin XhlA family protein [Bacillus cereus]MCU5445972.1 hemolysin XhlA family protein [Bacillus cereus]MCU5481744.1 hemolysin XhlA family protein [Bacillus cereus]